MKRQRLAEQGPYFGRGFGQVSRATLFTCERPSSASRIEPRFVFFHRRAGRSVTENECWCEPTDTTNRRPFYHQSQSSLKRTAFPLGGPPSAHILEDILIPRPGSSPVRAGREGFGSPQLLCDSPLTLS